MMKSGVISVPLVKLKLDIKIHCGCFNKSFSSASVFKISAISFLVTSKFFKLGGILENFAFSSSETLRLHCT